MKKKIILTLTICLFAAGSIFNMNLAQNDQNMDISLADISIMAQAEDEIQGCHNSCRLTSSTEIKDSSGNVIDVKVTTVCSACCGIGQKAECSNGIFGIGGGCRCK
jgi:hypothetical protein